MPSNKSALDVEQLDNAAHGPVMARQAKRLHRPRNAISSTRERLGQHMQSPGCTHGHDGVGRPGPPAGALQTEKCTSWQRAPAQSKSARMCESGILGPLAASANAMQSALHSSSQGMLASQRRRGEPAQATHFAVPSSGCKAASHPQPLHVQQASQEAVCEARARASNRLTSATAVQPSSAAEQLTDADSHQMPKGLRTLANAEHMSGAHYLCPPAHATKQQRAYVS